MHQETKQVCKESTCMLYQLSCEEAKPTTYLMTMTSVSVQMTRDRAPITSSSEGALLKTLGHRYSGDVPVMQEC